jgi:hypothetical protein
MSAIDCIPLDLITSPQLTLGFINCVLTIHTMITNIIKSTLSYAFYAAVLVVGVDTAYKAVTTNHIESLCSPVLKHPGLYECKF